MSIEEEYPGSRYQELFEHMADEHNLILLESQMDDIVIICLNLQGLDRYGKAIISQTPNK